jgi:Calcineurin-like phosphoesterase
VRLLYCIGLVSVLAACHKQQPIQLPYSVLWNDSIQKQLLRDEVKFAPDITLDSDWKFMLGLATETLDVIQLPEPDSLIELPHRILAPNTAMWYSNTISFPTAGVLSIQADDGAQLWIDSQQAQRLKGDNFLVKASSKSKVLIRVLNNAMSGGLRQVAYFKQPRYDSLIAMQTASTAKLLAQERSILLKGSKRPLLIGPWLTQTDSFYTIRMLSDKAMPISLQWGLQSDKLAITESKTGKLVSFQINRIPAPWFYKICAGTTCTSVYEIKPEQSDFTFSVWGDSQSGWNNFSKLMYHLRESDDVFTVGVGDLVGAGFQEVEWRTFAGLLSDFTADRPAYLIAGNHDYDGYYSDMKPYLYHQYASPDNKSWFAWAYSNCAFIAIDPNARFPIGFSQEQKTWFHQQLQSDKWKQATWRFVFIHQPPYSQGWAGYEGDTVVRNLLEPVIEKAGIDFVIAGHTHDYERLTKKYGEQSTQYIITGGGGGSLEPNESSVQPEMDTVIKTHHYLRFTISSTKVEWSVYDLKNQMIDKQVVQ